MCVDLSHLEVLLTIIDEGSFDGAAAVLRVTPSAVSQRIKTLEQQAGQVLVRRTKPVSATEAAIPYVQAARQIRAVVEQTLETTTATGQVLPPIPIAANADSLDSWLIPALASVRDVATFHLVRDDQDHTAEFLRSGAVMAGITSTEVPVQGCESTRLGVMRYIPIAHPEFVQQWLPNGLIEEAVARAPVLYFDRKDRLQHQFLATINLDHLNPPRNYIPANGAFHEAIRQEMGWGMVPEMLAAPMINAGEAMHLGGHVDITLFWQQWKLSSPPLTALRSAILDAAAYSLRIS